MLRIIFFNKTLFNVRLYDEKTQTRVSTIRVCFGMNTEEKIFKTDLPLLFSSRQHTPLHRACIHNRVSYIGIICSTNTKKTCVLLDFTLIQFMLWIMFVRNFLRTNTFHMLRICTIVCSRKIYTQLEEK